MNTNQTGPDNQPGQEQEERYFEVAKVSFARIWYNRFLWFWGIFLPAGFYLNLPNIQAPVEPVEEQALQFAEQITRFIQQYGQYVVIGLVITGIMFILWWVLSAIARAGTLRTLNLIQNNQVRKEFSLGYVWKAGWRGAFTILKLDVVVLVSLLSVLVVLVVPLMLLSRHADPMLLWLVSLCAFVIFAPLVFLGVFLRSIGAIHITLAHQRTIPAIEVAYLQLTRNLREGVKIFFLVTLLEVFEMMILMLVAVLMILIAAGSTLLFSLLGEKFIDSSLIVMTAVLGIMMLAFYFWVKSIFSLWSLDLWLWWSKKFGGIKVEELLKTEEKEILVEKTEPAVGGLD